MRVIIVGLGVQGNKRRAVAGKEVVATVDPVHPEADYCSLADVPLNLYDAALVCTPDDAKIELLTHLLSNGKHLLVEKPLFATNNSVLETLAKTAALNNAVCYTAYNHRFEPHFVRMKQVIDSGKLGKIYCVRMFYGNGTARLVRDSAWRDQGAGVLPDLGSHLLDTVLFWFGKPSAPFEIYSCNRFENLSFDHFSFGANGMPVLQLEMTLLNWRNHFYADVFAEKGSAHIQSLCKWGPSTFTLRDRKLPSGRPDDEAITLVQADPTWELEYQHFKRLCTKGESNIENDMWINSVLSDLTQRSLGPIL
ncbi:MAG: gfo/Idh/MocA family oxidoreductase [Deltaproteobacteria bacterium CG_4_10_14_0_2_um_filter_43_8]|nr:MAG: oxidoreductase [Deltaproteobacteria bacterium CG11_big_fil_rev_8_21_14_0_20_42_23]PJA21723.1 MAG: gfo/Idh/MocA family oxidoreductase [Deltaproteobacteria bacterium CG_4_10_14_0_2_um_filter_43_8]PJC64570.1 MAG: gfo/Idh/MocA family oxidoreductase [Deltaproteobacteria bacterium CG_4_9_14_0_2_um_filter_42_21]